MPIATPRAQVHSTTISDFVAVQSLKLDRATFLFHHANVYRSLQRIALKRRWKWVSAYYARKAALLETQASELLRL